MSGNNIVNHESSGNISRIDGEAVHRICSGQVVLSLAIAVKELVENSIDASATIIDVKLKEYGSDCIEVSDNGVGVKNENFQSLTLKHYTSKLKEFSDLEAVSTLGFRGEALSSLCALTELIVITRHSSAEHATKIIYDHNGKIVNSFPAAREVGTTVILHDLFKSLPVRRKEFLKNLKREFNRMCQLMYAYCLVSKNIKITFSNQTSKGSKSTILATLGSSSVKDNIISIFGPKQALSLVKIDAVEPDEVILNEFNLKHVVYGEPLPFEFEFYISSAVHGSGRSVPDRQFFYVNDRPCEPQKVMRVVNDVYKQFNTNQYPFVYLNVKTDRSSVDVNVTPDKRQIFLEKEKFLLAVIKASLIEGFKTIPSTFTMQNTSIEMKITDYTVASKRGLKRPYSNDEGHKNSQNSFNFCKFKKSQSENGLSSKSGVFTDMLNETCEENEEKIENVKESNNILDNTYSNQHEEEINIEKKICLNSIQKKIEKRDEKNYETLNNSSTESITLTSPPIQGKKTKQEKLTSIFSKFKSDTVLSTSNITSDISPPKLRKTSSAKTRIKSFKDEIEIEEEDSLTDVDISSDSNDENKLSNISKIEPSFASENVKDFEDLTKKNCSKFTELKTNTSKNGVICTIKTSVSQILKALKSSSKFGKNKQKEINVRFRSKIAPDANKNAEQELQKEISKDMFKKMSIIGQFNLGFIITKLENDLFIVDQHAADEKYNYETLQKNTVLHSQTLVIPKPLELCATYENILIDNIEVFKKNGFNFTIEKNAPVTKKVFLTAIPMSKNYSFGKDDIEEMLFMIQENVNPEVCRPSRIQYMFASRACRKSVMIGDALSVSNMRKIVDHMADLDQPWNCPHGRPTMRHLVNLDLIENQV